MNQKKFLAKQRIAPAQAPVPEVACGQFVGLTHQHASQEATPPAVAPHVRISLASSGALQIELPGPNGTARAIGLAYGHEVEIIQRILCAKRDSRIAIGEDGAPTTTQVRHWTQHYMFPSHECAFCIAEGRATSRSHRRQSQSAAPRSVGDGSVTVRRLPPRGKHANVARTRTSAEELGL